MKKLKELLMESYAWEKKPGKPLPTLAEVQAEYERKMAKQRVSESHNDLGVEEPYYVEISVKDAKRAIDMITNVPMLRGALNRNIITTYGSNVYATQNQTMFRMLMDVLEDAKIELSSSSANVDDPEYVWKEQFDYGNRKPKFGKGSMYNDEPDFDKGVVGGSKDRVVNTKWDAIVDEYNSKPGFTVETGTKPRLYLAKITNTQTGDWWEAKFKNVVWTYTCEVGGKWSYLKSIDELIKKFNEANTI